MKTKIHKLMTATLALAIVGGGLASTEALAKKKKIGMVVFDAVRKAAQGNSEEAESDARTSQTADQTQPSAACTTDCPPASAQQVKPKPGQSEPTRPDPK